MTSDVDKCCRLNIKLCSLIVSIIGFNLTGPCALTVVIFGMFDIPMTILCFAYAIAMIGTLMQEPMVLMFVMITLGATWVIIVYYFTFSTYFTIRLAQLSPHFIPVIVLPLFIGFIMGHIVFSLVVFNKARIFFKH